MAEDSSRLCPRPLTQEVHKEGDEQLEEDGADRMEKGIQVFVHTFAGGCSAKVGKHTITFGKLKAS